MCQHVTTEGKSDGVAAGGGREQWKASLENSHLKHTLKVKEKEEPPTKSTNKALKMKGQRSARQRGWLRNIRDRKVAAKIPSEDEALVRDGTGFNYR